MLLFQQIEKEPYFERYSKFVQHVQWWRFCVPGMKFMRRSRYLMLREQLKEQNAAHRKFRQKMCQFCSPEYRPQALCEVYQDVMGKALNLKNPQAFSEKIQWSKIYDATPLMTFLVDKVLVRNSGSRGQTSSF